MPLAWCQLTLFWHMSHLSTTELATLAGFSKRQVQRMAANGEIPGAQRTTGGHWKIADSPELREWVRNFSKRPSAQQIVERNDSKQHAEAIALAKEILERAHSLRCLLRKIGWAYDSPLWGFLYQELWPLRLTLETLRMPLEEAMTYVEEEKRAARERGVMVD
jgi:excisionase family DNA binding protein